MAMQAAGNHAAIPMQQPVVGVFPLEINMRSLAHSTIADGIIYSIAAKIFTAFSPFGGFWFGAAYSLSNRAIDAIYLIGNINANDRAAKTIKDNLKFFESPAIAALFSTAIGFSIHFPGAILLHLSTYGLVIGGVLCAAVAAVTVLGAIAAIAIGRRMYRDGCNVRQAIENVRNDIRNNARQAIENIRNDIRNNAVRNRNAQGNAIGALDQLQRMILQAFQRPQRHQPAEPAERQGCG
jgi:hypothetical protein